MEIKNTNLDPTATSRKRDHIELALRSQVQELDSRFYYEPLFAAHPDRNAPLAPFAFLGKTMRVPMWVSSMTGGTALARTINHNLARACGEFGMGMGLGSCRQLLHSDEYLSDFAVRHLIGEAQPLYVNLGIAQIEELIAANQLHKITELINRLEADGLIIHVNPLQEWLQPEGDRFAAPPLVTIQRVIDAVDTSIIVKEVGQGFGYRSLKALFELPLAAIDFAAAGGTNFSKLELLRAPQTTQDTYMPFAQVGHSADEMVGFTNAILAELGSAALCKSVIVSGGVSNCLDGYYYINKINTTAVYGQASAFLLHARGDYDTLAQYITTQVDGLRMAEAVLTVR